MTSRQSLIEDIVQQVDAMPEFGQLQIFVRSHLGQIGKADIVKMTTTRYAGTEPNVTLATDVLRLIKSLTEARASGNLGFSITFKDGIAETMAVQDFRKV